MSATTVQAKVYFPNQQIRRISFHKETEISEFKKDLIQAYESSPLFVAVEYDTQLLYLDEERDWIMVNTQPEWSTALNNLKDQELLRVKVIIIRKKKEEMVPRRVRFGPGRRCEFAMNHPLFRLLSQRGEKQEETQSVDQTQAPQQQTESSEEKKLESPVPTEQAEERTAEEPAQEELVEEKVSEVTSSNEPEPTHHTEQTSSTSAEPEQSNEAKYENELKLLESMGFTNSDLNKHFVHHFNGDLPQVVSSLLNLQ